MSRKLYAVGEVAVAVLDKMRAAELRDRNPHLRSGPFWWGYTTLDPVPMPDGGRAPQGKIKAALAHLQTEGHVAAAGSGWRLTDAAMALVRAERLQAEAAEALERR